MYDKILEILMSSSLNALVDDNEIENMATELEDEVQSAVDEKVDETKETIQEDHDKIVRNLESRIRSLDIRVQEYEDRTPSLPTLVDTMTMEWVKENWEGITKLYNLNKSTKDILNMYSYGETLQNMSIEAAPIVAEMIDKEIIKDLVELGNVFMSDSSTEDIYTPDINTHKRIVLVGRAASGKDHARKLFTNRDYKYAVSFTTRPPRDGEIDGVDYYFLTDEKFQQMIEANEFYEYVSFNGWHYGTSNAQFYNDNIFIMTPHGVSKIKPEDRASTFIMYFDMPLDIRKERLMLRNDADKVDRRIAADDLDFQDFTDFDLRIKNSDF